MAREEFEAELRAAGFEKDEVAEEWRRPADACNAGARLPLDAIDDVVLVGGTYALRLLLEATLDEIDVPSAVDQLGDVVRTDDAAGEVLGLVLGAL